MWLATRLACHGANAAWPVRLDRTPPDKRVAAFRSKLRAASRSLFSASAASATSCNRTSRGGPSPAASSGIGAALHVFQNVEPAWLPPQQPSRFLAGETLVERQAHARAPAACVHLEDRQRLGTPVATHEP